MCIFIYLVIKMIAVVGINGNSVVCSGSWSSSIQLVFDRRHSQNVDVTIWIGSVGNVVLLPYSSYWLGYHSSLLALSLSYKINVGCPSYGVKKVAELHGKWCQSQQVALFFLNLFGSYGIFCRICLVVT